MTTRHNGRALRQSRWQYDIGMARGFGDVKITATMVNSKPAKRVIPSCWPFRCGLIPGLHGTDNHGFYLPFHLEWVFSFANADLGTPSKKPVVGASREMILRQYCQRPE